jgi:hypothetical protein
VGRISPSLQGFQIGSDPGQQHFDRHRGPHPISRSNAVITPAPSARCMRSALNSTITHTTATSELQRCQKMAPEKHEQQ